MKLELGATALSLKDLEATARHGAKISIGQNAMAKMAKSRQKVDETVSLGQPVYGINTGFGSLSNIRIDGKDTQNLQRNLIASHTCAVGEALPREVVKGAMVLRANALAQGFSGIRPEVVGLLVDMVNRDIIPRVPLYGSVGASGDLALLSTIAGCMCAQMENDEYRIFVGKDGNWVEMSAAQALKEAGLSPVTLSAKEGLALNNGCQVSTSMGALALCDGTRALRASDIALAITAQALLARSSPFDGRIAKARPHKGHIAQSNIIRKLLQGSKLIDYDTAKVQDAYSVRCAPQVVGAVREAASYAKAALETEMNSATDNPLIFDDILSGGNFHGAPIAQVCDLLSIAFTDLASICERRTFRLLTGHLSGLPSFLAANPGLSSGLMIAQYTAANLVSACKTLSHPASVDSIPTCEDQEDHVSMAPVAAWKLAKITENLTYVVAIELLCACRAVSMRLKVLGLPNSAISANTLPAFELVLKTVGTGLEDAPLSGKIQSVYGLITTSRLFEGSSHIWEQDIVD